MQEIQQLLNITQKLREQYKRGFPLDGRLVGDIGEVLAAKKYGLELLPENSYKHDAKELSTGRLIQIKASFKENCYFPHGADKLPDYFLAIHILENGEIEELYNGPGYYILENYIQKRNIKHYKESYYTLSKGVLRLLNSEVSNNEKIKIIKS